VNMRRCRKGILLLAAPVVSCRYLAACGNREDSRAEAPPPAVVERQQNTEIFEVQHPEQFRLAAAVAHTSTTQLSVTGVVTPDVSRNVPVISIATGRVVEVKAKLGDFVKKGQLLLRVQSADLSAALADHRKAVADEALARAQCERAKLLHDKGAISLNDLQVAEDAEVKARVDVENTTERLRVLGAGADHASAIVDIRAPADGVITEQQVTNAAGVAGLGSPNPFIISDLSSVWVICDVYENDLAGVSVGENAEIRLNAFPGEVFRGRISNISPILDPSLRTAKVRIEVRNHGLMRIGMFATATFHGQKREVHAAVPASAILHLHDRNWVYVPAERNKFRRIEVRTGETLPGNLQEVFSGVQPGERVVENALVLQNTVEQ